MKPMMVYGLVDATAQTVRRGKFLSIEDAQQTMKIGTKVDHGVAMRGIGIVVHEGGLFVPAERQHYFSIGFRLYAGNAVLYAYGESGETIDYHGPAPVRFYSGAAEVELAIRNAEIIRPAIGINTWQWPQPAPADLAHIVPDA